MPDSIGFWSRSTLNKRQRRDTTTSLGTQAAETVTSRDINSSNSKPEKRAKHAEISDSIYSLVSA